MISRPDLRLIFPALLTLIALICTPAGAATVTGDTAKWYPITLDFDGPSASESDQSPNPFLDYRLNVTLTAPSGTKTVVPGFFAGDGNGGGTGSVWRVRFSANEVGQWSYQASFRAGSEVAVSLEDNAGSAADINGANGSFDVSARRNNAPGFLREGRLNYVSKHYLKFDDGSYWIKGGTDSPENLLGYRGFDGTESHGGINKNFLHDYINHEKDWNPEDPLFQSDRSGFDSRGIIGALNYLNSVGVNSVYFLPMNLGGDGQDSYPFINAGNNRNDKTHYDISKLHQWNTVFDHAQRKSIFLHFVLSETEPENERWFDNGKMGVERKLFFRELVARFGYVLAGKWNLGEENDFPVSELRSQAKYLNAIDWSNKPITVHTQINDFRDYEKIVGDSLFSATSIQYDWEFAGEFVERWRKESTAKGHPWVLDMDENTGGVAQSNSNNRRKQILYDVFFSGGQIEWYFGYHPLPIGGDVTAGDFRQREQIWSYTTHARRFMEAELPFWDMEPADELVSGESSFFGGAEVFAKRGDIYAIYLPQANQSPKLNLGGASGSFKLSWFNPRNGSFEGESKTLNGGSTQALGKPPSATNDDWVVLVKREGYSFSKPQPSSDDVPAPTPEPEPEPVPAPDPVSPTVPEPEPEPSTSVAPSFLAVDPLLAIPGETLNFSVVAIDEDGVAPVMTVEQDLPPGMSINGVGGGILEFTWNVPVTQTESPTITVVAIDSITSSQRVTLDISIAIGDVPAPETDPAPEPVPDPEPHPEPTPPVDAAPQPDPQPVADPQPTPEPAPVDGTNQSPVVVGLSDRSVMVGERLSIPVIAIDPDGFVPSIFSNNLPLGASLDDNGDGTRALNWVPEPTQLGLHTVELIVQDAIDLSLTTTQSWVFEVIDQTVDTAPLFATSDQAAPMNQAPFFPNIPAQQVIAGQQFVLRVRPIDPEGIAPHLQLENSLEGARFGDDGDGGRTLLWTPNEEDMGVVTLRFIATDHDDPSLSAKLNVELTINPN